MRERDRHTQHHAQHHARRRAQRRTQRHAQHPCLRSIMRNITRSFTRSSVKTQRRAQEKLTGEIFRSATPSLLIRTRKSYEGILMRLRLFLICSGRGVRVYLTFFYASGPPVVKLNPILFGVSCRDNCLIVVRCCLLTVSIANCCNSSNFSIYCESILVPAGLSNKLRSGCQKYADGHVFRQILSPLWSSGLGA